MLDGEACKFRRKYPNDREASAHMALMWVDHERFAVRSTPRYLYVSASETKWLFRKYENVRVIVFSAKGYFLAFS